MHTIKRRKMSHFSYIVRYNKYKLRQRIIQGKIVRKWNVGRRGHSWVKNLREWFGWNTTLYSLKRQLLGSGLPRCCPTFDRSGTTKRRKRLQREEKRIKLHSFKPFVHCCIFHLYLYLLLSLSFNDIAIGLNPKHWCNGFCKPYYYYKHY